MWNIYVAATDASCNYYSESDLNTLFCFNRWHLHQKHLIKALKFTLTLQHLRYLKCEFGLYFFDQRFEMWVLLIQLVNSDDFNALFECPIKCFFCEVGLSANLIRFSE